MSSSSSKSMSSSSEDDNELRRGPWTLEEDTMLTQYIAKHREGRWNLLAKRSGLRRTGKSCRLRWLNYLKPDVKRGNLTPQEQLLILELHFKWGNRWSKIARHLPGRTDNEIKNYWRTRVQKKARHLKIDADSREFKQLLGRFWVPRLLQKARDSWSSSAMSVENQPAPLLLDTVSDQYSATGTTPPQIPILTFSDQHQHNLELDQNMCSSESANAPILPQFMGSIATPFPAPDNTDTSTYVYDGYTVNPDMESFNLEAAMTAVQDMEYHVGDCQVEQSNWVNNEFSCNMSNMDELWQFRNLQS